MAAPVFMTTPSPSTLSEPAFLSRVGLDLANPQHEHTFTTMQCEARAAWHRLRYDRRALLPHFRGDPTLQPPFTGTKISSQALMEEVAYIYRNASRDTRLLYDISRADNSTSSEPDTSLPEQNWVIKWVIWRAYRQENMVDRRRDSAIPWQSNGHDSRSCDLSPTLGTLPPPDRENARRQFWDPSMGGNLLHRITAAVNYDCMYCLRHLPVASPWAFDEEQGKTHLAALDRWTSPTSKPAVFAQDGELAMKDCLSRGIASQKSSGKSSTDVKWPGVNALTFDPLRAHPQALFHETLGHLCPRLIS